MGGGGGGGGGGGVGAVGNGAPCKKTFGLEIKDKTIKKELWIHVNNNNEKKL